MICAGIRKPFGLGPIDVRAQESEYGGNVTFGERLVDLFH
jgi:hypothetical protein